MTGIGTLVFALKRDFLPSDHDDEIWNEIKNRIQQSTEKVAIVIATMQNLFSKHTKSPLEQEILHFTRISCPYRPFRNQFGNGTIQCM